MKKLLFVIASMILSFTLSACTSQTHHKQITPTVSTVDLLADALKHYDMGNYEEAIITYLEIIEIEPKNFTAQLGLGKSYRNNGNTQEAIAALLYAQELDDSNVETLYELAYAYMSDNRYTEAENLMTALWNDGNGDPQAGITLLLTLAGREKVDAIQALLENESLQAALANIAETNCIYIGAYDSNGMRTGQGIGLYPEGYIYAGEYSEGMRSGLGSWYYPNQSYYVGAWADDMPNGDGTIYLNFGGYYRGYFVNGLAEGDFYYQTRGALQYRYNCASGVPQPMGTATSDNAHGETIMAYMKQGNRDWEVAPHYWSGLQCNGCGSESVDGSMPKWFEDAFSHTWSGWRGNAEVFAVAPWS